MKAKKSDKAMIWLVVLVVVLSAVFTWNALDASNTSNIKEKSRNINNELGESSSLSNTGEGQISVNLISTSKGV